MACLQNENSERHFGRTSVGAPNDHIFNMDKLTGGNQMQLKQIVLRLARNPGFPEGDRDQGYVIVAPLNNDAKLDVDVWRDVKKHCTVKRFHPDDALAADGLLTHRGSHWHFHYPILYMAPMQKPCFMMDTENWFPFGSKISIAKPSR